MANENSTKVSLGQVGAIIEAIWDEHQSGNRNNADVIWAIYTLYVWMDEYLNDIGVNKSQRVIN